MKIEKLAERKQWTAPKVRETAPAKQTRGGGFAQNDQDDAFYDLS